MPKPKDAQAKEPAALPSFEAALGRLEEVVRRLEGADVGLEESMGLFEEGVGLARHCSELLARAEKRIEQLVEREDGTYSLKPFEGLPGAAPAALDPGSPASREDAQK
jgi:exodeoxyribonuclease VII small subunit